MKDKRKKENLYDCAKDKSFEEFEKEQGIKTYEGKPLQKRFGYPKSNYYTLLTNEKAEENRKIVDEFLILDN